MSTDTRRWQPLNETSPPRCWWEGKTEKFFFRSPPFPFLSGSDGEKHQNNNSRWLPVEDWLITEEKILHSSLSDSTKKKKKNANKMRTQFISFLHRLPPCFLHPPDFVLINEKNSWIFIAAKRKPQRIKHKNLWRSWWHFWFPQPQSLFSAKLFSMKVRFKV